MNIPDHFEVSLNKPLVDPSPIGPPVSSSPRDIRTRNVSRSTPIDRAHDEIGAPDLSADVTETRSDSDGGALDAALHRLDSMADKVINKAEKTRARIQGSDLPEEEKAKLLERVKKTEEVALQRLTRVKSKLTSLPSSDAQEGPEQARERQPAQSEQRQAGVMSLVHEKRKAFDNTTLVPGAGGPPLSDRLPESAHTD